MITYRYQVISLHFDDVCNLNCSFCYKKENKVTKIKKPHEFYLKMIPYLKQMTPQVAVGGGETFMYPLFIMNFAKECKKNGLLFNVTTNGTLFTDMSDELLYEYTKDITMISVSFDSEKYKTFNSYKKVIDKLRNVYSGKIGCNLLLEDYMFKEENVDGIMIPKTLITLLLFMFNTLKINMVYLLYPKNIPLKTNITQYKTFLLSLGNKFKQLYMDDLTKEILLQGYDNWLKPCHYGRDIISINEYGYATGCSFDNNKKGFYLDVPKDVLLLKNKSWDKRMMCPYLVKPKNMNKVNKNDNKR